MCTSKILTNLCLIKQKTKTKKTFGSIVSSVLAVKEFWQNNKICSKINGKQTVKLKSGFTEFKNYSSQIPASFKISADFECILRSVKSNKGFYTEKYQDHIPCSLSYKLVCVDKNLVSKLFTEVEILLIDLLK